jgi:hypothetical protein
LYFYNHPPCVGGSFRARSYTYKNNPFVSLSLSQQICRYIWHLFDGVGYYFLYDTSFLLLIISLVHFSSFYLSTRLPRLPAHCSLWLIATKAIFCFLPYPPENKPEGEGFISILPFFLPSVFPFPFSFPSVPNPQSLVSPRSFLSYIPVVHAPHPACLFFRVTEFHSGKPQTTHRPSVHLSFTLWP